MIAKVEAATRSLHGVALGDAFGETWFFRPAAEMEWLIAERLVPRGPWPWTDDTAMALSLYRVLREHGHVAQDRLADRLARAYAADPYRNYGPSMHGVLQAIGDGEPWQSVTAAQFDGQGSWGNGAAMRVAPLGAWFADDLDRVVEQAALSAAVTHAHPEAAAGAIAVAVAAALAVGQVPAEDLLAGGGRPYTAGRGRGSATAGRPTTVFSAAAPDRRGGRLRSPDLRPGHRAVRDLVRRPTPRRPCRGAVGDGQRWR
jgi:ADP-ribosylglycohydrolase